MLENYSSNLSNWKNYRNGNVSENIDNDRIEQLLLW